LKYFEVTLISDGIKSVQYLLKPTKREAFIYAQANFTGTLIKIREIPIPLMLFMKNLKDNILSRFKTKKLNTGEFTVFIKQVAIMIKAGIPIRETFLESVSSSKDRFIIEMGQDIISNIDSGLSLADSFRIYEDRLGNITISMIELGEQTGTLSKSLLKLCEILDEQESNRSKIINAIRIPLISLVIMSMAFILLILTVVPKFEDIFAKMKAELPLVTKFLIGCDYFLSHYGYILISILLFLVFLGDKFYKKNSIFKIKTDELIVKIYIIGDLLKTGIYSRYMMILSELIRSGIPLNKALNSASQTISNSYLKQKIHTLSSSIQKGYSLSDSLDRIDLFENMTIQMIKAGERSGELENMLSEIANYYHNKFQNKINILGVLIEPILMGFISIMVLILALGIFLPMWDLSYVAMG
jgi:general secretion pathway protein F/MSHA biogenesis protein MshG